MKTLLRLFAAVERLIRHLVGLAARGGDREALLLEALEALDRLLEAVTTVPELTEEAFIAAVAEVLPDGAPLHELTPEAEEAGRRLEERLTEATETARERIPEAIRSVTPENLEERAQDATTALRTEDGRRLQLGRYAEAVGRHELQRIFNEGAVSVLDEVRFSAHGTIHPACKPHEGRVYASDEAPVPPLHPGCNHRLGPV